MTEHLRLMARKLEHLKQMRAYLSYSLMRAKVIFPVTSWEMLEPEQHETLAAFRIRFSEFQEHLGKIMRAVAIEEEIDTERFGTVLAFMEKLGILESVTRWKIIRELRNAVNHEYEESTERLTEFLMEMIKATSELMTCHQRLVEYCDKAYGIKA